MRVAPALALAASGLLLASTPASAGPLEEPVSLEVTAPARVAVGETFNLTVAVAADPGALDIAAQPLRLRVRLEPECGGSFAGSEGPTAIDRVLPAPAPGGRYSAEASGSTRLGSAGPVTVCAFLEDAQERQFATETETTVLVGSGVGARVTCAAATHNLTQLKRRLTKQRQRIRRLRRARHHAHNEQRSRALDKRLRAARRQRHRLAVRLRRARHAAAIACPGGN